MSRSETERLFVYGTLLVPKVMEIVIGRRMAGRSATLAGFVRFQMRGELFPGIVPQAESETRGLLFDDISRAELGQLDDYEGPMYQRVEVRVLLGPEGGDIQAPLDALVYRLRPEHGHQLSDVPWDPERFAAEELGRFLRREFAATGPE